VLGYLLADKTLTDEETRRLTQYYASMGAKGVLVPTGPELAGDPSTWVGSENWSVDVGAGRATLTNSSTSNDDLSLGLLPSDLVGELFMASFTVESLSGGGVNIAGSRTGGHVVKSASGSYTDILFSTLVGSGSLIVNIGAGGQSCVVSGISVRRITTEGAF
jgi:hypothetical protein